jgi:hypothetical protein
MHDRRQRYRSALGITTGDYLITDLVPGLLRVLRISDPAYITWNTGIAVVRTWPVVTLYCLPALGTGASAILGDVRQQDGDWFTDMNKRVEIIPNPGLPIGSARAVAVDPKDRPVLDDALNHMRPTWYCPICRFVWNAPGRIRECRGCGFQNGIQKAAVLAPRPAPPTPALGAWAATRLALALHRAERERPMALTRLTTSNQSRSIEDSAVLVKPEPVSRGRINGIEI